MGTAAIFHFELGSGDWFTPKMFLSQDKTTLDFFLSGAYKEPQGYSLELLSVAVILVYLPPMLLFFFHGRRYIVQSIVTTSIKGVRTTFLETEW